MQRISLEYFVITKKSQRLYQGIQTQPFLCEISTEVVILYVKMLYYIYIFFSMNTIFFYVHTKIIEMLLI